ncbi:MAG: hypothetical protein HYW28_11790 [Rhodospirillales bacterium]|nr:hypothetical protein [Rhodospirillales bacterium]
MSVRKSRQARRAFVAALVLSAALTAAAGAAEGPKGHWTSGERLFGWCLTEVAGMTENPLCVGFVGAVADVLAENTAVSGYRVCLRGDLVTQPAVTLVARALAREWPCP